MHAVSRTKKTRSFIMPLSFTCIAFVLFSSCFSSTDTAPAPPHLYGPVARIVVNGQHTCGASILSRDWVLTAAHCLIGVKYQDTKIFVGDHRLSVVDDPEQTVNATQFIIHQDYDKTNQFHDIALILVDPAIEFSPKVTCVNTPACGFSGSDKFEVVGWGKHDFGSGEPSEELMRENSFLISEDKCKEKLPKIPNIKYVLCSEPGKSTCAGDTGGPIFVESDRTSFTQTGVYSYSDGGCDQGVTVFTKVSEYAQWIDRRTRGCGNFPFY